MVHMTSLISLDCPWDGAGTNVGVVRCKLTLGLRWCDEPDCSKWTVAGSVLLRRTLLNNGYCR